jgi:hypothetical protein
MWKGYQAFGSTTYRYTKLHYVTGYEYDGITPNQKALVQRALVSLEQFRDYSAGQFRNRCRGYFHSRPHLIQESVRSVGLVNEYGWRWHTLHKHEHPGAGAVQSVDK